MDRKINSFVFLDLETTGLPRDENNTTKITELCAVAVHANHLDLGLFPRVNNKLSLCLNPQKLINPMAADLTGLSNELLEHQTTFNSDTVDLMKQWLSQCPPPVCLVAHNGDFFDFPILRAEIEKTTNSLPEDILAIDAIPAFKSLDLQQVSTLPAVIQAQGVNHKGVPIEFDDDFDEILLRIADEYDKDEKRQFELQLIPVVQRLNEETPKKQILKTVPIPPKTPKRGMATWKGGYKLQDVYQRLTNKRVEGAHEAEKDVLMLITCAATYGEKFVAYANEHARKFSAIPIMQPGRRLGF